MHLLLLLRLLMRVFLVRDCHGDYDDYDGGGGDDDDHEYND